MKPRNTIEFLDELKSRFKLTSDYKLAKLLQVHQTSVSNYRKGRTFLSPEIALKVGALLEISPGYILACVEEERAERTNRPLIRDAWHEVARALAPMFAAGIIGTGALLAPSPSPASNGQEYTLHALRRRWPARPLQMAQNRRSRPRGTFPRQIPLKIDLTRSPSHAH